MELIREYFSEAIYYGGSATETGDLEWLKQTLDYVARDLPPSEDTLSAGLGFSDDRLQRRIDRMTSNSTNLPFVGTKQSDSNMMSGKGYYYICLYLVPFLLLLLLTGH